MKDEQRERAEQMGTAFPELDDAARRRAEARVAAGAEAHAAHAHESVLLQIVRAYN